MPHILPQKEHFAVYMLPSVQFRTYKKWTLNTARKNTDVSFSFVTIADNNNTAGYIFIPHKCIVLL